MQQVALMLLLRYVILGAALVACSAQTSSSPLHGSAAPPADDPSAPPAAPSEDTTACAEHEADFDALAKRLEAELTKQQAPGGSIAVLCQGKRVFARGVGSTAKTGGAPVKETTRFQLASITKVFTAATALRLAEQQKLRLDEPVKDQIPFLDGKKPYDRAFTWAELLSHSAGFPTYFDDDDLDLEPRIVKHANDPLWAPPGAVFDYSNEGYAVAGLGLQKAAGKPYAELVTAEIFQRAGMTGATFDAARLEKDGDFAIGDSADGGGPVMPTDGYLASTYYAPMGGAWTSAADLARFARALMSGDVITKESLSTMTTARTKAFPGSSYGLGLEITDRGGVTTWSHTGGVAGFAADMVIAPSEGFAVVVLVNSDTAWVDLEAEAFHAMTGKTLGEPKKDAPQAGDADAILGDYQSVSLGKLTVQKNATTGSLELVQGGKTVPLEPQAVRDTYAFDASDGYPDTATFWREDGAVRYLVAGTGIGTKQ